MKNNKLVKFSLTLICSAVLAACGSSGGSDNSAAQQQAQQQAKAAAEKAAAEKAAAEKAAAEKAAAEKAAKTTSSESNPGYLLSKKNASDFIVNKNGDKVDSTQSAPLPMTVQNLEPRLDTIVVAYPHEGAESKAIAYIEDFQFVGNDKQDGKFTLTGIYNDSTDRGTTGGTPRPESRTKTDTQGTESGAALVYEKDRIAYFDRADRNAEGKDTLAEVYGLRTNSYEDGKELKDTDANNLPLVKETNKLAAQQDGQLRFVQYGRVTTKLHDLTEKDLNVYKKGLLDDKNSNVTSNVIGFANYGEAGTENSYFYRGLNNTTGEQLAKLSGELVYHGHAVAYGLNNDYRPGEANKTGAPNAIGVEKEVDALKSGYHVLAKVNLADKNVTGSIYNTWNNDKTGDYNVDLVNFNGKLDNYGNIAGTSALAYEDANKDGSFNATLFGSQASELGGNVAGSKNADTTVTQWGAVFGAKKYEEAVSTPEKIVNKPWAARADENTAGQVK